MHRSDLKSADRKHGAGIKLSALRIMVVMLIEFPEYQIHGVAIKIAIDIAGTLAATK